MEILNQKVDAILANEIDMAENPYEKREFKEVQASEILALIEENKPIIYDNIIIKTNLDIRKLNLLKQNGKFLINSSIKITNSCLCCETSFVGVLFRRTIDFSSTQFRGNPYFGGSEFRKNATFKKSQFSGNSYFGDSLFCENVDFMNSEFEGYAYFRKSKFCGNADFRKSQFSGTSSFGGSEFRGNAGFNESQFRGDAYFRESLFEANADFSRSKFKEDALFENAKFKKIGGLFLDRSRFQKLYIKYIDIKSSLSQNSEAYLSLVENYKRLGWFEDADECYYDYRKKCSIADPIKRIFDLAARFSFGYGVKPARPLICSALIIAASGIIFKLYLSTSLADAFFLSATAFTSGVNSVLNSTIANVPRDGFPLGIFTLERLLGPLFFALFLATIGKTIIR